MKSKKKKQPNFKKVKSHVFNQGKYKIIWKKRPKCQGMCLPPDVKPKRLYIDPNLDDKEFLICAIDESIHSNLWALDDFIVDIMSDTIGDFLFRLGYRRINE